MSDFPGRWWHPLPDGRIQCDLCPRDCRLRDGQRGALLRAPAPGRAASCSPPTAARRGFCVDPIEKKPLNHFFPGTPVLSFGTAGCNLACKFCQNWDISKSREIDTLMDAASPEAIAAAAAGHGCRSVAFTYNDPVIFAEYAIDVAEACRARGIATVAVTAGYIGADARREFFATMDAANVDLKAFTDDFYCKLCGAQLAPVLDTLAYVRHETDVWLEITTLLIPGQERLRRRARRRCPAGSPRELGPDVPLHFTAFHPDYKMTDVAATPAATLTRARAIARGERPALRLHRQRPRPHRRHHVLPGLRRPLIVRDWHEILAYELTPEGACGHCGTPIPGRFGRFMPAHGRRRMPVRIAMAS